MPNKCRKIIYAVKDIYKIHSRDNTKPNKTCIRMRLYKNVKKSKVFDRSNSMPTINITFKIILMVSLPLVLLTLLLTSGLNISSKPNF